MAARSLLAIDLLAGHAVSLDPVGAGVVDQDGTHQVAGKRVVTVRGRHVDLEALCAGDSLEARRPRIGIGQQAAARFGEADSTTRLRCATGSAGPSPPHPCLSVSSRMYDRPAALNSL